jgi:hypothetical protein
MPTLGNTPRPAYVYDTETDTWVPVGVGAHTHSDIPNTLVDAKGDLITATADNVPARLAKGADGTVLVSDSTTSTGLAWQPYGAQSVAGKNFFINGSMEFWQRATSFNTPGGAYTADRWKATVNGAGTYVVSRQSTGLDGFQYCLRFQRSAGQTYTHGSFIGYAWAPEDAILLQGKTVTYSFYARKGSDFSSTSPASGISAQLQQGTGSGTHAFSALTNETNVLTGNATLTTAWQRFSFTGTVASNTTELRTNIAHSPNGTAGANDYFEITGIQLEIGPVATPFSRYAGGYANEFAACQRYYYKIGPSDGSSSSFLYSPLGMANATTQVIVTFPFPQIMRVKPTSIEYTNPRVSDGANVSTATSLILGDASSSLGSANVNGSGFTLFRNYWMMNNSNSSLAFNAEL